MIAILRKTAARGPLPEMTQMMSLHAGVMETMNAFGKGLGEKAGGYPD